MTKSEIAKFLILRTIGNFLVLFAIFGVLATFGPTLFYEVTYQIAHARGTEYKVADIQPVDSSSPEVSPTPVTNGGFAALIGSNNAGQVLTPKDTGFNILIPKIGANAKVFPNVDPTDEVEDLKILSQGVAHAKGTVFPGMNGNIYLFAHSTDNFWNVGRYNAIFYLLKDVKPGDDVVVYFEDVRHNYVVTDSQIVDPSDVTPIVDAQKTGQEQLILQTCWPPGTTFKRLLVFAKPK